MLIIMSECARHLPFEIIQWSDFKVDQKMKKNPGGRSGGMKFTLSPIARKLLKIAYFILFGLSLAVVIAYLYLTFFVTPPDVGGTPTPPVSTSTGNGNTGAPTNTGAGTVTPDPTPVEPARRTEVYTCLIFGMDDGYGNTDTIMVASFDVPNKKIGLMSIPRDTVISLENSIAYNKINAVYGQNGVPGLKEEISELLGIPLDFYVKVRLSAFEKLVNAVGGVYFDVPVDMHYFDPDQDLLIDLTAGPQTLTGEQAMGLVRFRQDNSGVGYGDTGRTHTQQEFLKAMLGQVLAGADLGDIPTLVDILVNYVETDANVNDMIYFGRALIGMELGEALQTETLPAMWEYPYMWAIPDKALETINRLVNPYETDITEGMVEFFQP